MLGLRHAGPAPCRPEIDDDNLPFVFFKADLSAPAGVVELKNRLIPDVHIRHGGQSETNQCNNRREKSARQSADHFDSVWDRSNYLGALRSISSIAALASLAGALFGNAAITS